MVMSTRSANEIEDQLALDRFHPILRRWFSESFAGPTLAQSRSWPEIASGQNEDRKIAGDVRRVMKRVSEIEKDTVLHTLLADLREKRLQALN